MPARSTRSPPACLPIALGEATKTVPLRPGRRARSTASRSRWGVETDTDDAEGKVDRDLRRPAGARTRSRPRCPPSSARSCSARRPISAIKIDGERAYDLARDGETVELEPSGRSSIHRLDAGRHARRRPRGARGRVRQGHLCPLARPRPRPRASARRGHVIGAPPARGRPVRRGRARAARGADHGRARRPTAPRPATASCMPIDIALRRLPEVVIAATDAAARAARPAGAAPRPRRPARGRPVHATCGGAASPSARSRPASSTRGGCSRP